MNIEKLLNYMLADAFGKLAVSIEAAINGEDLAVEELEHVRAFIAILKGEQIMMGADINKMMAQLGTLEAGGADSPTDMQEVLNELKRTTKEGDTSKDTGGDDGGK